MGEKARVLLLGRYALLLALVLTVAVIAVFIIVYLPNDNPDYRGPDPGPKAVRSYIEDYVAALNANDADVVSELAGVHAESQILQEVLRLYGGRDLIVVDITILQDFPYLYCVWITAQAGDGAENEMYQVVEWTGDRWDIGLYPGPPPPKD